MRHAVEVMGTAFAVDIDGDAGHDAVDRVVEWWREVEARFSTFLPDSEISRIGRGELDLDDAHPDVRHVLSICSELEELTRGLFSIRPGGSDGPRVDPAAYVKGWSVDEAALLLRSEGITDFMLYAGGDVLCSGAPAGEEHWRVGIRDPRDREQVVAVVAISRGAVATSGAYERGAHVWGPDPGAGFGSVTATGPSLGLADALATAVFAGGSAGDLSWLEGFEGYGVLVVRDDGTLAMAGHAMNLTG